MSGLDYSGEAVARPGSAFQERRDVRVGTGQAMLEPGDVFAERYEVLRLLGEGDRKRTFLARDIKVGRSVAVSLVKQDAIFSDPEGTEREAKVLGRIGSHPNVVSLYDYEIQTDGAVEYMVFEYLSRGTLTEYLRETGRLPLGDLLRLGRELCHGLGHLHKRGLLHRDVSPDNVWLDERGVAHLGDFDSAVTSTGAEGRPPLTTNVFAAPEERDGGTVDARSDLFSLGGLLYAAATGADRVGDLTLVRSQRPDLPSAFGDLVASLLCESPSDRPPDADSVLQWLDEVGHASHVDTLIAAGESDSTEFKASLHHLYGPLPVDLHNRVKAGILNSAQAQNEVKKRLRTAATKTIAAFLNSGGGTLLIGVADTGTVLGIEPDLAHLGTRQDLDAWMSSVKDVIINALSPEVWSAVHVSLVRHQNGTVAVVHCPRRTVETWHQDDSGERFYIRASNATHELHGSSMVRYIREHWST